MATQAQITAVQQLYVGYLGRAADSAGLAFWADAIANGTATIASVATGFTLSNEYKAAYAGLDSAALVDQVYTNVLGRAADAEGKAYWVDALAKGTVTADTLVSFIVTNLGALDQATINNKVFVAQTYTDTVGAAYNPTAGADVLVGVDSTPASVTTALSAIAGGTLAGQVPALGLITAVDTALAAQVAYETANTATADALVTKLAANTAITYTDSIDAATSTYAHKVAAVVADADIFRNEVTITGSVNGISVGDKDTSVIESRAVTAQKAVDAAITKLSLTEKAAVSEFTTALATQATAEKGVATATEKGAAVGGLDADATADAGFATLTITANPDATQAQQVYSLYVNGSTAERTAIDTAFKDSSFYSSFKVAAVKDASLVDANNAVETAAGKLSSSEGQTYLNAYEVKFATDAAVTAAKAADADVAAAKVLADAYAVKTDAVDAAHTALDTAVSDSVTSATDGVLLHELSVTPATQANLTAAKDVFFFGATVQYNPIADTNTLVKAALTSDSDFIIGTGTGATQFGAGDSIVLGSGFTFNSGALSTGNNNVSEFFLVQKGSDTLVVIETAAYGSASVTGTAAGATTLSPEAAVITLTGVTADHLSVANGVVSYV